MTTIHRTKKWRYRFPRWKAGEWTNLTFNRAYSSNEVRLLIQAELRTQQNPVVRRGH